MTNRKFCAALADAIQPKSPFGISGPYPYLPPDLTEALALLMARMNDDADDDGIVTDFCECFGLSKRAVLAAIAAYRQALRATVH